jgi:hypothetical protein
MGNIRMRESKKRSHSFAAVVMSMALVGCGGLLVGGPIRAQATSEAPAQTRVPPAVGTIKSIGGNTILLTNEAGAEIKVQLSPDVKYLRVPPDSKDLKAATPIQASDLQVGDRILVRGKPGDAAGTFLAATIISMKKADLDEKQKHEREEWQRHGIGGLVKSVDPATGMVAISTMAAAGSKDVEVQIAKTTVLRRYAPGSVKFDDAKPSSLTAIRAGDQLRARGTRSEDGATFSADEIVTGSFRNIAGTVSAVDSNAGTMAVLDLASNKTVEVKMSSESQLRKLPQPMAQRIAMRLKGLTPEAGAGGAAEAAGKPGAAPGANSNAGSGAAPTSQMATGAVSGMGQGGLGRAGGGGGGGDLQQMLSRLPVAPLSDFQKGDAVMIVATSGQTESQVVAITLLGGVEPILQASPQGQAASILSPWSLNSGGGGDAGTP